MLRTDLQRFWIYTKVRKTNKSMKKGDEEPDDEEDTYWGQNCKLVWGNRISQDQFKTVSNPNIALEIVDKRVAPFVKFFSSILNFSTNFLVSHQSFVSMFDLRET